jgi:hypothetical protein
MADMYDRIFVYSLEQRKTKEEIAKRMNKRYSPGNVIIKGKAKPYTDIFRKIENCPYGDAVVVAQGDIRRINYTNAQNR